MKATWQKLAARFNGLARRERALVAAASIGGVLLVGYSLLADPVNTRNRLLRQNIERQSRELAGLQDQSAALDGKLRIDLDAGKRAEIAGLKAELRRADEQLAKMESGLIPPERMNLVLESLLRRHPGLRLVSFKTLATSGLVERPPEKGEAAPAPQDFNLFRHGVEIQLEGSFTDLHAYLAQLEQSPQKFLWGEMRFTVVEHPKNILTLVVYTLSSDKAWLAI